MKSAFTGFILLFTLSFSIHSVAADGIKEVLDLTEKYIKLCQTDDIKHVMPSLVADGLNKPSRGSTPTKTIDDWEFEVEIPGQGFKMWLSHQQSAGINPPFICNISASLKSGDTRDFSFIKSDFLPLMINIFGAPTRTETHPKKSEIYHAQWCQTPKGGMELSAVNPQVKRWANAGQGADVVNVFRIGMSLWQGKDKYCR